MNLTSRHLRILLIIVIVVCTLIYVDTYLTPRRHSAETITDMEVLFKPKRSGIFAATTTYIIHTGAGEYVVPLFPFNLLASGMTVDVEKSYVTGAAQGLSFEDKSELRYYPTGYMRTGLGKWLAPLVLFSAAALMFFLPRISNPNGARNLTIALLIFSILTLLSYLGITKF